MVFSGFPKVQPPLFFRSRALRGRPAAPPASERPAAAAPIPMHCGARSSQRYRSWVPAEPAEATHRLHEGRPKTSRKYMEIYGNTIHVARILSWDLFIFFQSSSLQKARISLKNKCLKYGGCFDKRRRVLNKCSQVSNNPWKKSKKCSLSSQSFFWNVIHFPAAFDKPILHDVQPSKPEQSTFQNVRQFLRKTYSCTICDGFYSAYSLLKWVLSSFLYKCRAPQLKTQYILLNQLQPSATLFVLLSRCSLASKASSTSVKTWKD